ncbi:LOW QUALITY PROTEIN: hypothetical protein Cgig2_027361 [Carnegiea gigantea]|uniref:Uncharacterized protein n=1 Tax=Carnegiea gigantea TaxID=171969 RepID=A0A9Q1GMU3_9CARY|nr:LOW QUALITY PROTEIN: hypothetical protein Cgig2_027361 [Carnegiea gigantea]
MGAEELLKMVREMIGSDMSEEKLWYSLKYDREMLIAVKGDNNVQVIFKGNDEDGYIYVAENAGSVRSLGVKGGELPASSLHLGGDTIKMSDDNDISVASKDAGDEEATKEDNAGDEQAAEKQCGDGNKRKGCVDGNDVNDNHGVDQQLSISCEARAADLHLQAMMHGLPRCYALAVIAKANRWAYDYVHPIYKTATQEVIYNQLVHPMETHNMGIVDAKTWLVVSREERDEDYNWCILPPNNGRHLGRPPSKRRESFTSVFPIAIPYTYVSTTPPDMFDIHTVTCRTPPHHGWWLIPVLRRISLALSNPTVISVTTIMAALVIASNPLRFGRKDASTMPLQFQTAMRMSVPE